MSIPELGLTVVTVTVITFVALGLMVAHAAKRVAYSVVAKIKNRWFL